jgi:hypothetical protein
MAEWLKAAVLKTNFSHELSPSKSTKSSCKPWAYRHFLVHYSSFSFIAFHRDTWDKSVTLRPVGHFCGRVSHLRGNQFAL